jgi:hypothetical protein
MQIFFLDVDGNNVYQVLDPTNEERKLAMRSDTLLYKGHVYDYTPSISPDIYLFVEVETKKVSVFPERT